MADILVLAGGVGGAKLVDGLAQAVGQARLTVIGNTGDDAEFHGLWVSPDLDILTYTLADVVDHAKGWGYRDESFATQERLAALGNETWMNLGDRDLATHILRTGLRHQGERPTAIAARIARQLGLSATLLPPTDDDLQTLIDTPGGTLNFQQFFVRDRCGPPIRDVRYAGAETARPTPEVLEAIATARLILIAPSNPIASIGPILAVPGIREALAAAVGPRLAISPIVRGRSLKGPSDRMLRAKGYRSDPTGVAACYAGLIDAMVIDVRDRRHGDAMRAGGLTVATLDTIMRDRRDRGRLAGQVLDFAAELASRRDAPRRSA
ncbi:MAG: 2-phospho-L-lactate transferase [Alphaproteobacteria bacterium]